MITVVQLFKKISSKVSVPGPRRFMIFINDLPEYLSKFPCFGNASGFKIIPIEQQTLNSSTAKFAQMAKSKQRGIDYE